MWYTITSGCIDELCTYVHIYKQLFSGDVKTECVRLLTSSPSNFSHFVLKMKGKYVSRIKGDSGWRFVIGGYMYIPSLYVSKNWSPTPTDLIAGWQTKY